MARTDASKGASMLSYVGIDLRADITWVTHPFPESARLLGEGKIDAYLGIAPEPQELRARKIGRLMFDSVDRRDQPEAAGLGQLLPDRAREPVLRHCEAVGRADGPARSDAGEESAGLRLEKVEYGVSRRGRP